MITGTSTEVGKTVATAALTAAAIDRGASVAVCKPAQTGVGPGEPGDIAEVRRLTGVRATAESFRYRDPLAPDRAARREGAPFVDLETVLSAVSQFDDHDLTLVEGAGGALVRLAPDLTILDVAAGLDAPLLVVAAAGLGTLNHTELTIRAIEAAGLDCAGIVIGSWPDEPDLAERCNMEDLPLVTGVPIVGRIPTGAGRFDRRFFGAQARHWFDADWLSRLVVYPKSADAGDRAH
ncbi:dethiobiotin synthase [Williamsia soli]|uniref:dethiobiotin synthase n=1 Tax=Williamsia soli TaxID=364929 RepID=UPI0035573F25